MLRPLLDKVIDDPYPSPRFYPTYDQVRSPGAWLDSIRDPGDQLEAGMGLILHGGIPRGTPVHAALSKRLVGSIRSFVDSRVRPVNVDLGRLQAAIGAVHRHRIRNGGRDFVDVHRAMKREEMIFRMQLEQTPTREMIEHACAIYLMHRASAYHTPGVTDPDAVASLRKIFRRGLGTEYAPKSFGFDNFLTFRGRLDNHHDLVFKRALHSDVEDPAGYYREKMESLKLPHCPTNYALLGVMRHI